MSYPGIFHDAPYLPHSDDKLGRYFDLAERCFDFGRASLRSLETLESLETLRSARGITTNDIE